MEQCPHNCPALGTRFVPQTPHHLIREAWSEQMASLSSPPGAPLGPMPSAISLSSPIATSGASPMPPQPLFTGMMDLPPYFLPPNIPFVDCSQDPHALVPLPISHDRLSIASGSLPSCFSAMQTTASTSLASAVYTACLQSAPSSRLSMSTAEQEASLHDHSSDQHLPIKHDGSDSGLGTSVRAHDPTKKPWVPARPFSQANICDKGKSEIMNRVLMPLLEKESLKDFHGLVYQCIENLQQNQVACLRDIDKFLRDRGPTVAKCFATCQEFCSTFVNGLQTVLDLVRDQDKTLPHDPPYGQGYFLDFTRQFEHAFERKNSPCSEVQDVDMTNAGLTTLNHLDDFLILNNITGNLPQFNTGLAPEAGQHRMLPLRRKRQTSAADLDVDTGRPVKIYKCEVPNCEKCYHRPCDLNKHKKSHTRPFKCSYITCSFHEDGFPTRSERNRHFNDKHNPNPDKHKCEYCGHEPKRESNLKQHMQKKHGIKYCKTRGHRKRAQPVASPVIMSQNSAHSSTPSRGDQGDQSLFTQYAANRCRLPLADGEIPQLNYDDQMLTRVPADEESAEKSASPQQPFLGIPGLSDAHLAHTPSAFTRSSSPTAGSLLGPTCGGGTSIAGESTALSHTSAHTGKPDTMFLSDVSVDSTWNDLCNDESISADNCDKFDVFKLMEFPNDLPIFDGPDAVMLVN